mgnify:CR=1 FL=1|jgi:hypothetical protein
MVALYPLVYADGVPISDLTAGTTSYSDDNGISYIYGPLVGPYDPNVTDIRVEMNGIMTIDGTFSFQYQMKVD